MEVVTGNRARTVTCSPPILDSFGRRLVCPPLLPASPLHAGLHGDRTESISLALRTSCVPRICGVCYILVECPASQPSVFWSG